jgi:hypothetical protein
MLQFDPIDRIDIQEARALITGAAWLVVLE